MEPAMEPATLRVRLPDINSAEEEICRTNARFIEMFLNQNVHKNRYEVTCVHVNDNSNGSFLMVTLGTETFHFREPLKLKLATIVAFVLHFGHVEKYTGGTTDDFGEEAISVLNSRGPYSIREFSGDMTSYTKAVFQHTFGPVITSIKFISNGGEPLDYRFIIEKYAMTHVYRWELRNVSSFDAVYLLINKWIREDAVVGTSALIAIRERINQFQESMVRGGRAIHEIPNIAVVISTNHPGKYILLTRPLAHVYELEMHVAEQAIRLINDIRRKEFTICLNSLPMDSQEKLRRLLGDFETDVTNRANNNS